MAAVYAALDLGVEMVEVDVHSTLDGELVVIHDSTLTEQPMEMVMSEDVP